jgi:hypothetical protein
MAWWVDISPEVEKGITSFGLNSALVLSTIESYLRNASEEDMSVRWVLNPDDYFVYVHVTATTTLEFLVNDAAKVNGVLRLVWVERHQ